MIQMSCPCGKSIVMIKNKHLLPCYMKSEIDFDTYPVNIRVSRHIVDILTYLYRDVWIPKHRCVVTLAHIEPIVLLHTTHGILA